MSAFLNSAGKITEKTELRKRQKLSAAILSTKVSTSAQPILLDLLTPPRYPDERGAPSNYYHGDIILNCIL